MPGPDRTNHRPLPRLPGAAPPAPAARAIAAAIGLAIAASALARTEPHDPRDALQLLRAGKPQEALAILEAASAAEPASPHLLYNRALAHAALGELDQAQSLFDLAQRSPSAPRALAAAARHNLAAIAFRRALPEPGATPDSPPQDPSQTLDLLHQSEQLFRSALSLNPADSAAARKIELVQRLIDEIQRAVNEQPPPEQQQQQQQSQDQQGPDQQNQDQQNQDGQSPSGGQNQPQNHDGDQRDQDQQQSPQPGDQSTPSGQDQKQQPSQEQQQQQKQPQQQPAGDQQKNQKDEPRPHPASASQQQRHNQPFDLTAAQILDKERRDREQLQRLRNRNSRAIRPVEKDW